MFGLFKNRSLQKLQQQYNLKLEEARDLQRYGDIVAFAQKTAEAEEIRIQLEQLEDGQRSQS